MAFAHVSQKMGFTSQIILPETVPEHMKKLIKSFGVNVDQASNSQLFNKAKEQKQKCIL